MLEGGRWEVEYVWVTWPLPRSSVIYGDATRLNWNQLSELTRQIDGPLYIQSLTTSSLRQVTMNPLAVNSLTTQLKFSAISLNSIKSSDSLSVLKYFWKSRAVFWLSRIDRTNVSVRLMTPIDHHHYSQSSAHAKMRLDLPQQMRTTLISGTKINGRDAAIHSFGADDPENEFILVQFVSVTFNRQTSGHYMKQDQGGRRGYMSGKENGGPPTVRQNHRAKRKKKPTRVVDIVLSIVWSCLFVLFFPTHASSYGTRDTEEPRDRHRPLVFFFQPLAERRARADPILLNHRKFYLLPKTFWE